MFEKIDNSDDRYRTLVDLSPVGMFYADSQGKYAYVNERWCELAGMNSDNAFGEGWLEALHPEYRDQVYDEWRCAVSEGAIFCAEFQFMHGDGQVNRVLCQAKAELDANDQLTGYVGTVTDIADVCRVEQELLDSRENLAALAENIKEGIAIYQDDRVVYANQYLSKMMGYKDGSIIGLTIVDTVHEDYREELETRYQRRMQGKSVVDSIESVLLTAKGDSINVEMTASTTLWKGRPASLVAVRDITGRKAAEKEKERIVREVEQSRARFESMFESITDAVIYVDPDKKIQLINSAALRMFGYSIAEVVGCETGKLYADDVSFDVASNKDPMCNTRKDRVPYEMQYKRKDGSVFTGETSGAAVYTRDGVPLGNLSIVRDITIRKKENVLLREQSMIIDQIHDSVVATNLDGFINRWNRGAESLFGYAAQEAIGRHLRFLYPEDQHQMLENEIIIKLKSEGSLDLVVTMVKKSGLSFSGKLSLGLLKNLQGEVVGMIGYIIDISEIIQAQDSLKKSLTEKEVLLRELHHRVKNILQIISSLISMQSRKMRSKVAKDAFMETRDRIRAVTLIYEKLFGEGNLSEIDVKQYIEYIAKRLDSLYEASKNNIITEVTGDAVVLDMEKALPCGLIANELMTNVYKHAFSDGSSGNVGIKILSEGGGQYSITIEDDGMGIDKRKVKKGSFGMEIMATLAGQIDGSLDICRKKPGMRGTVARLLFSVGSGE